MKKESKGSMTIEATIALTSFLFFVLFLTNFGHVYRVQNDMAHTLAQAGQLLAFSSYEYEKNSLYTDIRDFIGSLEGETANVAVATRNAWNASNYPEAAFQAFKRCAGTETISAEFIDTVDLSKTKVENDNLWIEAEYPIDLPFAFFGIKQITLHQQIVCRLWK